MDDPTRIEGEGRSFLKEVDYGVKVASLEEAINESSDNIKSEEVKR